MKATGAKGSKYWAEGPWQGDQGNTPQCVGYAWAHWLSGHPIRQWLSPYGIYRMAQHEDEWEGENYDGTSVRAGAKVLKALGYIHEYRWAKSVEALVTCVLQHGPVVVGTDWREGMMETDENGFIHAEGLVLGGHAYIVNGVNTREEKARVRNSWGLDWGDSGKAYIHLKSLDKLIKAQGEACVAIEREAMPR